MRTELLKLQITSPGVRAQSARVSSRVRLNCDDDGIVCLDLDHNDRVSGPWSVLTPHTPYTGPHCSTGHPLYLSTSDICILTFAAAFCSAVCSCCSLFTIGHRFTAELLGLQVSGQYAAYGQQWLIMSESCHRYIIRSRRILVRSITPCLHLCILYSVFSHDERVH